MAGLLFLAFAFFAVAQASTVRNSGQSAADAAALAAAQEDRDELFDGFLDAVGNEGWQDWLDGLVDMQGNGCGEADHFAGSNDSDVLSCEPAQREGDDGYTVRIETRFDTGKSIVPGVSGKKAQSTATAVVQPRCEFDPDAEEVEITCEGEEFTIDPDDIDPELTPSDLFSVVLVD